MVSPEYGQKRPRKKMMFRFWFDLFSPLDKEAGDYLYVLRERKDGSYTKAIRNGARLLSSLEQGRVDVLLELFPHIQVLLNNHYMGGGQ